MAPSGRPRPPGPASSSSSAASAPPTSSQPPAAKSLPAILARKRKSDANDLNSSQDSYSSAVSTASSASSVTFSNMSLGQEDEFLAENLPPELLHPRFSSKDPATAASSCPATSSTSRVPFSSLTGASNRMATSSSQPPKPFSSQNKQLCKELPKLKVEETAMAVGSPPAAKRLKLRKSWSQFREFIRTTSLGGSRGPRPRGQTPFPTLKWADKQEMWDLICKKEFGMYKRGSSAQTMERHPALQARMRAILFDWIIEVCEVYRLHRETFYLAVDFVDRYLSITRDVPKNRLQLIGVTCLFIASKIEEIYPPKLSDFAYVTDGACKEDEILDMELVVLKDLNWGLSPMTPNAWIKLYMQVCTAASPASSSSSGIAADERDDTAFVTPQFSGVPYIRVMQLMDLAVLDISSLDFRYSILAAAAVAVVHGRELALAASCHKWDGELQQCVSWLLPFASALAEDRFRPSNKPLPNVSADNLHNIQTHSVDLAALDRAQEILRSTNRKSPDLSANPTLISVGITPPEAEGDVLMQQCCKATEQSPTVTSSSSAGASVFLSPETPTSTHQQSRAVAQTR